MFWKRILIRREGETPKRIDRETIALRTGKTELAVKAKNGRSGPQHLHVRVMPKSQPCDHVVRSQHSQHTVRFARIVQNTSAGAIVRHSCPHFGTADLNAPTRRVVRAPVSPLRRPYPPVHIPVRRPHRMSRITSKIYRWIGLSIIELQ
jgi:hypothetical protein